jgi:hypothetical protein
VTLTVHLHPAALTPSDPYDTVTVDANTWTIDDQGNLTLRKGNTDMASFPDGTWVRVSRNEEDPR